MKEKFSALQQGDSSMPRLHGFFYSRGSFTDFHRAPENESSENFDPTPYSLGFT
jgi:hypothetical protein